MSTTHVRRQGEWREKICKGRSYEKANNQYFATGIQKVPPSLASHREYDITRCIRSLAVSRSCRRRQRDDYVDADKRWWLRWQPTIRRQLRWSSFRQNHEKKSTEMPTNCQQTHFSSKKKIWTRRNYRWKNLIVRLRAGIFYLEKTPSLEQPAKQRHGAIKMISVRWIRSENL